jgi:hypothetical protein
MILPPQEGWFNMILDIQEGQKKRGLFVTPAYA